MLADKSSKIFFIFIIFILSVVIFVGCSTEEDYFTNNISPIQATYHITETETNLPMTITLREGESFYLETCDIKIEFSALAIDYPTTGNNRVYITSNYRNGNCYAQLEYDTSNGLFSYYPENETNYVFYFY